MPSIIPLVSPTRPGVFVTEDAAGFVPVAIATHTHIYMMGTSASGPFEVFTQVISPEDFTNKFGVSYSLPYVKTVFDNHTNAVLFFTRVSTADTTAPIVPTVSELQTCITRSSNRYIPLGAVICPEGYEKLTLQAERTALFNAIVGVCELYHWIHYADCAEATNTSAEAQTEGALYVSPLGHGAYFTPWIQRSDDDFVPPSPAIAAIGARKMSELGAGNVPAGIRYPLRGIKALAASYTDAEQDVLNPLGINLIRDLPNKGIVSWGARVRSSSPFYKFINTRIILNILERTMQDAFDDFLFNIIDGQGALFQRIRTTASTVCDRLYVAGLLYGATPADAYAVILDESNNPAIDLENGDIRMDIYVAPSPILEKLKIRVVRTTIGEVRTTVEGLGN